MDLRKFSIGRKSIVYDIILNRESTDETSATSERKETTHEEPLPELTKAFAALAPVFCAIMETGPEWTEGLTITRIIISRTKEGTRSVKLSGKKQLDSRRDFLHPVDAPMIQIDKPQGEESGSVQIEGKHVKLITKAIHEAERYVNGERSQTLLNFDQAKAALQSVADQGADMFAGGQ